jgi:hypothetical protein
MYCGYLSKYTFGKIIARNAVTGQKVIQFLGNVVIYPNNLHLKFIRFYYS